MKKLAFVFIVSIVFFSCTKEKQIIVENTDIPLISKILIDNVTYKEYTYNAANLISEEKTKFTFTRHTYNDNNQVQTSDYYIDPASYSSSWSVVEASLKRTDWVNPENTPKGLTRAYEFDQTGKLKRVSYLRPSVTNSEYSDYTWENNRISRQTLYFKDILSGFIDYLYDERGNVVKQSKTLITSLGIIWAMTTTEYEYDNMHNPYQSFNRLTDPGVNTNPNNITKEIYTIVRQSDGGSEVPQITNTSYEYNSLGYPVKVNESVEYIYCP
jgi:hypothetical protein